MSNINHRPPRRIPEWLSLQDISRAWNEETGEDAAAFEAGFRGWFEDYLVRNAYGEEDADVTAQLLEGRQIWRETFETFCEERGLAKPLFWFPETDQFAATIQPAVSEPVPIAEVEAAAPTPEAPKPPSRRRVREGGSSFTWIAAGLVVAVAAGSVTLWLQDMGTPVADASLESGMVAKAESATPVPVDPVPVDPVPVAPVSVDPVPVDPVPTDLATTDSASMQLAPAVIEVAVGPVATPAPTTVSNPAAAQIAAAPSASSQTEADVAPPPETPTAGPVRTKEAADQGLVLLLQRELQAAGYDPGPFDGKRGTKFANAIVTYQRANNLNADGRASIDLLSRLARENLEAGRMVSTAPIVVPVPTPAPETGQGAGRSQTAARDSGSTLKSRTPARDPAPKGRELVRAIQKRLADRGYYNGAIDGSLGPSTHRAIETYQRVQRYDATGQPSRAIYEELEDYALEVQGLDQFKKGAYGAAVVTYTRIILREPQNADAYFNRGLAYKNVGRSELALTDYDAAIELDPGHRKAYFDRANILYDQALYGDALLSYFKALKLFLSIG